jgi:transketolase
VREAAKLNGPVYLRLCRLDTPLIYEKDEDFKIGKGFQIGDGTDATVFATGVAVSEAVKAKDELEKQGINIRVVDMYSIKPIDEELIIKCAKETKKLISIEDHSVIGGLGSAISDVLTEKYPAKLIKIGINDEFGKSGKATVLLDYYGLSAKNIIEKVK